MVAAANELDTSFVHSFVHSTSQQLLLRYHHTVPTTHAPKNGKKLEIGAYLELGIFFGKKKIFVTTTVHIYVCAYFLRPPSHLTVLQRVSNLDRWCENPAKLVLKTRKVESNTNLLPFNTGISSTNKI